MEAFVCCSIGFAFMTKCHLGADREGERERERPFRCHKNCLFDLYYARTHTHTHTHTQTSRVIVTRSINFRYPIAIKDVTTDICYIVAHIDVMAWASSRVGIIPLTKFFCQHSPGMDEISLSLLWTLYLSTSIWAGPRGSAFTPLVLFFPPFLSPTVRLVGRCIN